MVLAPGVKQEDNSVRDDLPQEAPEGSTAVLITRDEFEHLKARLMAQP